jgi:hypothetical protein
VAGLAAAGVKSLAHYTNLSGLFGIIDTGELWASNVAFLNDREELLHGVKCARRALSTILNDRKLGQWGEAIGRVVEEIEAGRLPNTYAACFCEKPDLLSQWRGYAGNEQGVCLVFSAAGLDGLRRGRRSFLAPVEYGLVQGKMTLRKSLKARLLAIDEDELTSMDEEQKRATVYEVVSELMPRFKHKGFAAELEWRLVVQRETVPSSVSFRQNRHVLVPYIRLRNAGPLPLKHVTIGPGPDMDLTQRSIELFLDAKGYNVPVRRSRVPFRS